jgi:hypothetical protein
MTAAVVPAQLAGLDVQLPGLDAQFDVDGVADRFAEAWQTDVVDCRLLGARYDPGSACVTTYQVATSRGPATIGVVELTPGGSRLRRYDDDPDLPGLREAADPEVVATVLAASGGCKVAPVRYRPAERAVLRYDVAAEDGPAVHYGKVVRSGAADLAAACSHLHARARAGGPFAPEPTTVVDRLGLVVLPAVEGPSLHAVLFDDTIATSDRADACRAAGRAIARLHAGPPSAAVIAPDDASALKGAAGALLAIDPVLGERWAATLHALSVVDAEGADPVPSHGALRTDQIVVGPDGPALLDLDGFCAARPARDLGNLLAYLRWRAMRRPADGPAAAAGRVAFLTGYGDERSLPTANDLDRHEGLSLLKIAARRYRNLDVAEWSLVPDLVSVAAGLAGSTP